MHVVISSLNGLNGEATNSDDVEISVCKLGTSCTNTKCHWHKMKNTRVKGKNMEGAEARIARKNISKCNLRKLEQCDLGDVCTNLDCHFHLPKKFCSSIQTTPKDSDEVYVKKENNSNIHVQSFPEMDAFYANKDDTPGDEEVKDEMSEIVPNRKPIISKKQERINKAQFFALVKNNLGEIRYEKKNYQQKCFIISVWENHCMKINSISLNEFIASEAVPIFDNQQPMSTPEGEEWLYTYMHKYRIEIHVYKTDVRGFIVRNVRGLDNDGMNTTYIFSIWNYGIFGKAVFHDGEFRLIGEDAEKGDHFETLIGFISVPYTNTMLRNIRMDRHFENEKQATRCNSTRASDEEILTLVKNYQSDADFFLDAINKVAPVARKTPKEVKDVKNRITQESVINTPHDILPPIGNPSSVELVVNNLPEDTKEYDSIKNEGSNKDEVVKKKNTKCISVNDCVSMYCEKLNDFYKTAETSPINARHDKLATESEVTNEDSDTEENTDCDANSVTTSGSEVSSRFDPDHAVTTPPESPRSLSPPPPTSKKKVSFNDSTSIIPAEHRDCETCFAAGNVDGSETNLDSSLIENHFTEISDSAEKTEDMITASLIISDTPNPHIILYPDLGGDYSKHDQTIVDYPIKFNTLGHQSIKLIKYSSNNVNHDLRSFISKIGESFCSLLRTSDTYSTLGYSVESQSIANENKLIRLNLLGKIFNSFSSSSEGRKVISSDTGGKNIIIKRNKRNKFIDSTKDIYDTSRWAVVDSLLIQKFFSSNLMPAGSMMTGEAFATLPYRVYEAINKLVPSLTSKGSDSDITSMVTFIDCMGRKNSRFNILLDTISFIVNDLTIIQSKWSMSNGRTVVIKGMFPKN